MFYPWHVYVNWVPVLNAFSASSIPEAKLPFTTRACIISQNVKHVCVACIAYHLSASVSQQQKYQTVHNPNPKYNLRIGLSVGGKSSVIYPNTAVLQVSDNWHS